MGGAGVGRAALLLTVIWASTGVEVGTEIRALYREQYQPVAQSIAALLSTQPSDMLPLVMRLGWHATGNFNDALVPMGGSNGGCVRMLPERTDPGNNNLTTARALLEPIKETYPFITDADLYILAANTALEEMGSLPLYFTPGRADYDVTDPTPNSRCVPHGRLPKKHITDDVYPFPGGRDYHYKKFRELGVPLASPTGVLLDEGLRGSVALMGGHTIGGMHRETSGNDGRWTRTPFIFNNEYFQVLRDGAWGAGTATSRTDVDLQFEEDGLTMLPADLVLKLQPELAEVVEAYAANETMFQEDFRWAWVRLTMNGVTPAPGSDLVETPSPPGSSGCVASSLGMASGNGTTYACTKDLPLSGLSLHWTYDEAGDAVHLGVVSETTGWLGVGFPSSAGVMIPADAVIASDAGVLPYRMTGRSVSLVQVDELTRSSLGLRGEAVEQGGGVTVLRLTVSAGAVGVSDSSSTVALNVARDATSGTLAVHALSSVASITLDVASGVVNVVGSDLPFWRKLHAWLMVSAWCYFLPFGIIAKRYGKRVFGISDSMKRGLFGLGFVLHVGSMLIATALVTAAFIVALTKLNLGSLPEKGEHRKVGLAVYALLAASPLIGMVGPLLMPLPTSPGRRVFHFVHPVLGRVTWVLAVYQCFSGVERLRQSSEAAAEDLRLAVVVGVTMSVTAMGLLEFINKKCNIRQKRKGRSGDGPDKIPWSTVQDHDAKTDPWVVIEGKVYAISSFMNSHPGGPEALLDRAGGDATEAFNQVKHSGAAYAKLDTFYVGDVEDSRMDQAICLTEEIATAMVELDLDEASILIREAKSEVPASMLSAFAKLLENLCTYKPFLPASLTTLDHQSGEHTTYSLVPETSRASDRLSMAIESDPPTHACLAFTDIQSSTQLWEASPNGMATGLSKHNEVMREVLRKCEGYEVKTIGDAFMVAFQSAKNALQFGLDVQLALTQVNWPAALLEHPLCQEVYTKEGSLTWAGPRVRIGMHKGDVEPQPNPVTGRIDFFGNTVNKAARVEGTAVGGTVAVTEELLNSLTQDELAGFGALDMTPLGKVPLKGVKQLSNITILIPEVLRERKQEVLRSLYAKSVSDKPGMRSESMGSTPTLTSGMRGNMSRSPFYCQPASCASVRVNFSYLKQISNAGEEINYMFSSLIEMANRTEAVVQALYGGMVLLTWNVGRRSSHHATQAGKFAALITSNKRSSQFKLWGGHLHLGIASGLAVYGKVGTESQKSIATVGGVVELSAKVAGFCEDVGFFAGVAAIPGLRGVVDEPVVSAFTRVLDVWKVGGGEHVTVYELETLGLAQSMSAWGFFEGVVPEDGVWGEGFKEAVVLALHGDAGAAETVRGEVGKALGKRLCERCGGSTAVTCEECQQELCSTCAQHCVGHHPVPVEGGSTEALVWLVDHIDDVFTNKRELPRVQIGLLLKAPPTDDGCLHEPASPSPKTT